MATERPDSVPLPYDLRAGQACSAGYFESVTVFARCVADHVVAEAGPWLRGYEEHLTSVVGERPRSRGEHAVEYLTLGLLWDRYLGAAQRAPGALLHLLAGLASVRRRWPAAKAPVDALRGALAGVFLTPRIGSRPTDPTPGSGNLSRLLWWLRATGEFKDEVNRLANWAGFLRGRPEADQQACLRGADELLSWFRGQAKQELGPFTRDHERFVRERLPRYRLREDEVFCGKSEVEYHLNMVGAEIMNRGFRPSYERAGHRVVLVPGCMRLRDAQSCQAHEDGLDLSCTECSPCCHVARCTELGRRHGFEVFIVPHATSFSAWLERWKGRDDTALVAVACLLNLVPGGYEMRELGLSAQCVPLDFCGCQKHWHPDGIATDLNEERLLEVLRASDDQ